MSTSADERAARLLLSIVGEPGDPRVAALVDQVGPADAVDFLQARGRRGELGAALAQRIAAARPEETLAQAERRGLRFVTPADPEWPEALGDLDQVPTLHERGGTPVGLWLRGALRLDEAVAGSVAIVGARSATTYGAAVAGSMAADLAEAEVAVVSGAAFGIDQAAHRGALAARGTTVAVLACGADRAYPTAHQALVGYIAETGLVISEAPPGGAPTRIRFLARNRLIAALALGTVVVEAAVRSGALNTANWADALSRTLMGVPGPVTSAASQGVHRLVRTRNALLVTDAADVLEAVRPVGRQPAGSGTDRFLRPRDALTALEQEVLDAVPVERGAGADRVARAAGLPPETVARTLADLHAAGFVERSADRWRLVRQEPFDAPAEKEGGEFVG
ncbi:DNA-processing protein DprA [Nocardioides marmorisolisilvae]|uniref:DNA-protecting protein DprA n=1 Tax=Nocardioides marmorisolisilvae TaxID=1542737 RepID=A0A3N0DW66_9ACTN|nr:DNA-processing protein DprA [Nocardioides marmorisolisilvae]RNL79835.1 DNA-protecting protein DprA [Nocardioides marmorisolisilvae]